MADFTLARVFAQQLQWSRSTQTTRSASRNEKLAAVRPHRITTRRRLEIPTAPARGGGALVARRSHSG
ncbi:MAG: hypothetical protein JRJ58_02960 [Deltaproteobacteria bacterium]|nr:hypothetical protein [Deltaproteobacteria bacterium]